LSLSRASGRPAASPITGPAAATLSGTRARMCALHRKHAPRGARREGELVRCAPATSATTPKCPQRYPWPRRRPHRRRGRAGRRVAPGSRSVARDGWPVSSWRGGAFVQANAFPVDDLQQLAREYGTPALTAAIEKLGDD